MYYGLRGEMDTYLRVCSINRTSAVGSTSGPTSLLMPVLGLALRSHLILGDSVDLCGRAQLRVYLPLFTI